MSVEYILDISVIMQGFRMAALLGRGRTMSSLAVKGLKLGKGTPAAAVKANEVLVKMIASPINSGDLVTSTSGSEGVGMVAAKGDKVTALREGDWVRASWHNGLGE